MLRPSRTTACRTVRPCADANAFVTTLADPLTGAGYPWQARRGHVLAPLATYAGGFALQRTYGARRRDFVDATFTVTDYRTGVRACTVTRGAILRAAGAPTAALDATLRSDGSLAVAIAPAEERASPNPDTEVRGGLHPVYVDPRGRVRTAGALLTAARRVSVVPAGPRVLVASQGTSRGTGLARHFRCKGSWVIDVDGRRGFSLATEPRAGRLRIASAPRSWDGRTGIWDREIGGNPGERLLIVRQLGGVPLRRADRPSCATTTKSHAMSRDQSIDVGAY